MFSFMDIYHRSPPSTITVVVFNLKITVDDKMCNS